MGTVYQFDTFSQTVAMSNTGAWITNNEGYYYAIIPLEMGRVYAITLQNVTTLARFRVAHADSTEIGEANLSLVGYTDTPQDGFSLSFYAKHDYLICYGGTANGGEVAVTRLNQVNEIAGIWLLNDTLTFPFTNYAKPTEDKYTLVGKYTLTGFTYQNAGQTGEYESINISSQFNQAYLRFGEGGSHSVTNYCFTTDKWGYSVGSAPNYLIILGDAVVLEEIDNSGTNSLMPFATWLKANATKQGGEEVLTVITYNNETIATLEAGQTATIKTAETEVEHDIVVKAGGAKQGETAKPTVTNLTGTKWRFGEYLVSDYATAFEYNIETTYNVVCNSPYTNTFDKFSNFVDGANYRCLCTQFTGSTRSSIYYGYGSAPRIISNRRDGFEYTEVTFGEGADATNATLIAWLEANGTLVEAEPEPSVVVTYNGNEIASIKAGQTATIKCANTEMEHDIVVSAKAEEVEDELAGTWQLNDTVSAVNSTSYYWTLEATMQADGYSVTIPYSAGNYTYDEMAITYKVMNWLPRFKFATYGQGSYVNGQRFLYYGEDHTSTAVSVAGWYYENNGVHTPCSAPIIKITSKLAEVENGDTLLAYLQANATKQ